MTSSKTLGNSVRASISLFLLLVIFGTVRSSEFKAWRGLARLDDKDMVEMSTWIEQLGDKIEEALRYYWINNEIFYPYGAIVRGMFAIFNEHFKEKKLTPSFILGMEVMIHYILLKSYPTLGRKGGIRGSGQDKHILRAAIPPLTTCYARVANISANFTSDVFPVQARRKRHIRLPHVNQGHRHINQGHGHGHRVHGLFRRHKRFSEAPPTSENEAGSEGGHDLSRRFVYTLNTGLNSKVKKTRIDIPDVDLNKLENIAVSIFWLWYEVMHKVCEWSETDKKTFTTAFEGIVGLILSMYIYDADDYAEEYERIFRVPTAKYEYEWIKIEALVKQIQREKHLNIRRPYSDDI